MTGRVALLLLPLFSGCALFREEGPSPPVAQVEVTEDPVPLEWRTVITPADQARLDRAAEAWGRGLRAAARFRSEILAEGPLLDPRAALPRAAPSPGPYLCRVIRLGGRPAFAAFKTFHCHVEAEGGLLTMVKATGTQRPAGRLWSDGDGRMVFLGGLSSRDAAAPPPYGQDTRHDIAGLLERIGPFRWRLAVPFPQDGGVLDVYELVPLIPGAA